MGFLHDWIIHHKEVSYFSSAKYIRDTLAVEKKDDYENFGAGENEIRYKY